MKKLCLVLTLCLLLILTACGTPASDNEGSNPNAQTNNTAKTESIYTFKAANADNFEIKIDQNMADVLSALGEPLSYFEAASCAFDGLDKTYTYAGFVVTTRPDGDKDYVNSVFLTDDSVTTPEGIYIGATADAVIAAYGEGTQTDTQISYKDGNTTLNFIMKDGAVISIEYIPV